MMTESMDRIVGQDVTHDGYMACRGTACEHPNAVVTMFSSERNMHFDAKEATRLALFLLGAAGINIVGAAQKVVEAQRTHVRVGLGLMPGDEKETAPARAEAINELGSELAKIIKS